MRIRKYDGKKIGSLDKRPKGIKSEIACYDDLHKKGFEIVSKKGFPDFWARNEQGVILVECKKNGQQLSKAQFIVFDFLSEYGVPCFYYTEELGLRRFVNFKAISKRESKQLKREIFGS